MTKEELSRKLIGKYGWEAQLDIAIEEMAELTHAIMKFKRDESKYNAYGVLEEYVDVIIAIENVKQLLGNYCDEIEKEISQYKQYKIDRTVKRYLSEEQ